MRRCLGLHSQRLTEKGPSDGQIGTPQNANTYLSRMVTAADGACPYTAAAPSGMGETGCSDGLPAVSGRIRVELKPRSYCPRGVLAGGAAMERRLLRSKQSGAPPEPTAVGGLPGSYRPPIALEQRRTCATRYREVTSVCLRASVGRER